MSRFHLTYGFRRHSFPPYRTETRLTAAVPATTDCAFFSATESSLWLAPVAACPLSALSGAAFALCIYYKPLACACQRFFKKYHILLTFAKRDKARTRSLSLKLASRVTSFAPLPTTQLTRFSFGSP